MARCSSAPAVSAMPPILSSSGDQLRGTAGRLVTVAAYAVQRVLVIAHRILRRGERPLNIAGRGGARVANCLKCFLCLGGDSLQRRRGLDVQCAIRLAIASLAAAARLAASLMESPMPWEVFLIASPAFAIASAASEKAPAIWLDPALDEDTAASRPGTMSLASTPRMMSISPSDWDDIRFYRLRRDERLLASIRASRIASCAAVCMVSRASCCLPSNAGRMYGSAGW